MNERRSSGSAERRVPFPRVSGHVDGSNLVVALVRHQSRGPYRQRSLWRLLRVESTSADVLDHAAQGFRLFVDPAARRPLS
jgi:hypothetical protein